ncbi:magnesium/cobalt transporter CorA [Hydrogenivirga sp. 128-5-R1-1]|uniref:magnesium/cobalt transporter CorA n=1 Tax=Hydrogenivirga sp. 128-5-R1-1 TaxID=392423 RepID=UPI00015F0C13|nr:magnesium/cobalt transporter CorA [Hydrogenivirga sp. 128-5-R1-1]EDP75887.1 Mg(2+) and Co(2+) transport protein [Hydrogenivirga sp. 128-5-R1-1]
MIKLYTITGREVAEWEPSDFDKVRRKGILWVDALDPNAEEVAWLEKNIGFEMPSKEVMGDIEISSKYTEVGDAININMSFVIQQKEEIIVEPVFFFIRERYFVTLRYRDIPAILIFLNRLKTNRAYIQFAESLFAEILSLEVDRIGDRLEIVGKRIRNIWKKIFVEQSEELIKDIAYYDELNITLRESINEKVRILSRFLKSPLINAQTKRELKILLDDLNTLLDYTSFYMEKIDSIQNSLLGLITIRQNEAVKVFTVLATIFLPATLIASIFGMNFENMPELSWKYGYPYSLALMVLVTLALLLWVRRKGWL